MSALDEALSELVAIMDEPMSMIDEPHGPPPTSVPTGVETKKPEAVNFTQWSVGPNKKFFPVGTTLPALAAGIYVPTVIDSMVGLEKTSICSDQIYELPDMATQEVLAEVDTFWSNEQRYRHHNLMYKRGLLLWGSPGSGKTVTLKLLMKDLIQRNGLVIVVQNIGLAIAALKALRWIEPDRHVIIILEDIDEIIRYNGESVVLSFLDGEDNIDKVLYLATTNYPENLGARIMNRPSRFDRCIFVDMPSIEARKAYLQRATHGGLSEADTDRWAADTETLSIAHLRELVAAVYCLDQPYEEVLHRLTKMAIKVEGEEGFRKPEPTMGFSRKKLMPR